MLQVIKARSKYENWLQFGCPSIMFVTFLSKLLEITMKKKKKSHFRNSLRCNCFMNGFLEGQSCIRATMWTVVCFHGACINCTWGKNQEWVDVATIEGQSPHCEKSLEELKWLWGYLGIEQHSVWHTRFLKWHCAYFVLYHEMYDHSNNWLDF